MEKKMHSMVHTCKPRSNFPWRILTMLIDSLLEHPWSKIPDTFINLEGAGAGGFVHFILSFASVLNNGAIGAHCSSVPRHLHQFVRSKIKTSRVHTGTCYQQMPFHGVLLDPGPILKFMPMDQVLAPRWKELTSRFTNGEVNITQEAIPFPAQTVEKTQSGQC